MIVGRAQRAARCVVGVGDGEYFVASDVVGDPARTRARSSTSTTARWPCSRRDGYRDHDLDDGTRRQAGRARSTGTSSRSRRAATRTSCSRRSSSSPRRVREHAARPPARRGGHGAAGRPQPDATTSCATIDRIIITACGTSWHAGLIGEYMIEELARIPVEVEYASRVPLPQPDRRRPARWCIVISQSGETADTLAAMREAKRRGARALGHRATWSARPSRARPTAASTSTPAPRSASPRPRRSPRQVTALTLLTLQLGAPARPVAPSRAARSSRRCDALPEQDRADPRPSRRRSSEIAEALRAPQQLPLPRPRRTTSRSRSRARSSSRRSPTSTPRATRRPR